MSGKLPTILDLGIPQHFEPPTLSPERKAEFDKLIAAKKKEYEIEKAKSRKAARRQYLKDNFINLLILAVAIATLVVGIFSLLK